MTIRQIPCPAELDAALAFTPLVRDVQRADGWTPDRQRAFIAALARLGSVKAACAEVGLSTVGAYYMRRQKGAEEFARAWARAQAAGIRALRDIAYERAVDGTPRGVWYKGERVGEERRYNDRLLMFMLRHDQPASHGGLKRLPNGTKHPVTIEREARWADAEDAEFADTEAERAAADQEAEERATEFFELYIEKIAAERAARLEGNGSSADHYLRQATILEVLARVAGSSDRMRDYWDCFYASPGGSVPDPTPIMQLFDDLRRTAWERAGEPPRPDFSFWAPRLSINSWGGPNWRTRDSARREATNLMAHAVAMHHASCDEKAWAAWRNEVDGAAPAPLP